MMEEEILASALAALEKVTGLKGEPSARKVRLVPRRQPDAMVQIKGGRNAYEFVAEIKSVDRLQTPADVLMNFKDSRLRPLLVAPYISPTIAQHCRASELCFVDTAGNCFLSAPGLYVFVVGQKRPEGGFHRGRSAFTATDLRVAFAFLCKPNLVTAPYRVIANAAGASLGAVTNAMRNLSERRFLRQGRARKLLGPQQLLREWVMVYPITLRPKLHPRRFASALERPDTVDLSGSGAYWGGEAAAARLTQYVRPGAYTIYARKPIREVVRALRLRADPSGNVEVLDKFWGFPFDGPADLAPPVLAYADLLASGDGRNLEVAEKLYERHIKPSLELSAGADA